MLDPASSMLPLSRRRASWKPSARCRRLLLVLLAGMLSGTLLTTARAKPTLSFQLSKIPGFSHIIERRQRDAMKSYSERRLDVESLRMIYFHDQTVAVVELGPAKRLIGCELIEINNEADGVELLRNLSTINRPLEIAFQDMTKLMEQCEDVDRLNERNNQRATKVPDGSPDAYWIASERTHVEDDDDDDDNEGYQNDQDRGTTPEASSNEGFLAMIMKNRSSKRGIFQSSPLSLLSGILPGTKWCGTGDIAESYHDLGDDAAMDRCCRTHDLCPMKVRAYQKRYSLNNNSIYTKSHCKCDDMLYECLKQTNTSATQVLGTIYFNILQVPCVEDTPTGPKFRKAREGF